MLAKGDFALQTARQNDTEPFTEQLSNKEKIYLSTKPNKWS